MGGALLARWQEHPPAPDMQFFVVEPKAPHAHHASAHFFKDLASLPHDVVPSTIVLAVKPDMLAGVLAECRKRFSEQHPLYLSIAAGRTLAFYKKHLGEHAHVVRAMPNMPATIGHGMSALCAGATLPEAERHKADALMRAVGDTLWLADESLMHAATALSGSGPAYVFAFLDALARAGEKAGLAPADARKLAVATVAGAAALAGQSHDTFAALKQKIASPGGTTEAALAALARGGFEAAIEEAAAAAAARSKELAD